MIEKCNHKDDDGDCGIKTLVNKCDGEDNCITYQTYKNTLPKTRVARAKTPKKKKPKSIKYNKKGQMRHPPTAMKTLLKQVKESDKK